MTCGDFCHCASEWSLSAQPLIDSYCQSVLIAFSTWPALNLLWGHIGYRTRKVLEALRALIARTLRDEQGFSHP